jgi:carboxyl-terminal processing protease
MAITAHFNDGDRSLAQPGEFDVSDATKGSLQSESVALRGAPSQTHNDRASSPVAEKPVVDQSCPAAEKYKQIIDKTARTIFDLKSLGNLKDLRAKYNCQKDNNPFGVANDQISARTRDRFNYSITTEDWDDVAVESTPKRSGIGVRPHTFPIGTDGKPMMPIYTDNPPPPMSDAGEPESKEERVGILETFPGTPADGKFQPGDLIVQVDHTETSHTDRDTTVDLLRGPTGTHVAVTIERNGQRITQDLIRQDYVTPTVEPAKDIEGFTYIAINGFNENTPDELAKAMKAFPHTKGYIVDVRNNPGGDIEGAITSAEHFIKKGEILNLTERVDSDPSKPEYKIFQYSVDAHKRYITSAPLGHPGKATTNATHTRAEYLAGDKPTVVLVNGNTCSAAEIFTGALGDNGRVVFGSGGDPNANRDDQGKQHGKNKGTYGKGIGYVLDELPGGGGLSTTYSHYTTPAGTWPGDADRHRYGLRPDFVVPNKDGVVPGSPQDARLQAAIRELEEELRGHKHKKVLQ